MSRIRGVVFSGVGEPIVVRDDVMLAPPGPREVEVTVAAAGVCHSDLHVTTGEWEVPIPTVLGHEGSGVVSAVGKDVTSLEVGDHVVLSWVANCGSCRQCTAGRPVQCSTYAEVISPNGVLFDGTSRLSVGGLPAYHYLGVSSFAEKVVVPDSGAVKVRKDAPLQDIALLGCGVATGMGAVTNTAQVPTGATVAIIGCGGVGLSCVQAAKRAGAARIVAVDIVQSKLDLAVRLGATDTVNTAGGSDPAADVRDVVPDGFDYVFDAIGRVTTTETAISLLGLGGAAVIVGMPPTGSSARFDPLALAAADQRILGCNYGSIVPHRDIPLLVDEVMSGGIELGPLISGRRPLSDAAAALDDLSSGGALRQLLIPELASATS
ncbi:alcohol dehydrogenase catalytic domain-containing protein [Mycolicibacterium hodleri]|nr:Zn-dependent alcohol dehydrogenase [Mycolicibacterium hodleri]